MFFIARAVLTVFWIVAVSHLLIGYLPDNIGEWVNRVAVIMGAVHLAEMWLFKRRIQAASNPKLEALYIFLFGAAQGLDKKTSKEPV